MVKVVYYKSLGRRRYYRRYISRYFYRKNKKYANRVSLNYYSAKIHFEYSIFKKNNQGGTQGIGWIISDVPRAVEFPNGVSLALVLQGDPEFAMYKNLYDDVKLLGISVLCVPNAGNVSNNLTSNVPVQIQFKNDGLAAYGGSLTLNPLQVSKKYWRNMNRKYVPISQSEGQIGAGNGLPGWLVVNTAADTTTQQHSPSWNLIVNVYLKFRKNKNN